jgi:hypothetical protein
MYEVVMGSRADHERPGGGIETGLLVARAVVARVVMPGIGATRWRLR